MPLGGALVRATGALLAMCVVVAALGAFALKGEVDAFVTTPASSEAKNFVLKIPRGAGPQVVSRLLAKHGVVSDAEKFAYFLRYEKAAPKLRAGEFLFSTGATPPEVLEVLVSGREHTYPVTFPEGLRIEEMAARAEEAGLGPAEEYIRLARDEAFISAQNLGLTPMPPNLEGILIPETYAFPAGATVKDAVQAQVRRFKRLWTDPKRKARAQELGMSPYEVVTLASVVEKETGQARERPLIAGVFHNRLKKGMRLESDPTIIYGLENYDGNIRRKDIRRPHPWNTYVIFGLPPTPIAGAGQAAIDAVLWPDTTDALFFVSRNDGTHHFSPTYAEHARMVNKYQRLRGKTKKTKKTKKK